MNIFETLRKDHDVQRKIADDLIQTHGESTSREALFSNLKTELKAHAVAEERHFYNPLMEHDLTKKNHDIV